MRKLRDGFCQFSCRDLRLFQCIPRRADLDEEGVSPQVLVVAVFRQGQIPTDAGVLFFQQDLLGNFLGEGYARAVLADFNGSCIAAERNVYLIYIQLNYYSILKENRICRIYRLQIIHKKRDYPI